MFQTGKVDNRNDDWAASSSNKDIFIDDEGIEGSGARGEVTSDLESSGSGWGPDDEDARGGSGAGPLITFKHSSTSTQSTPELPDDEDYAPTSSIAVDTTTTTTTTTLIKLLPDIHITHSE